MGSIANENSNNNAMSPDIDEDDHMSEEGNEEQNTRQEELIDHDEEELPDERITIDNINIMMEMNTLQLAIEEAVEYPATNQPPTHGYNLRERPTKRKQQVSLAMGIKITGVAKERQYTTIHSKVHAHVMLSQMNVREGLSAFGQK